MSNINIERCLSFTDQEMQLIERMSVVELYEFLKNKSEIEKSQNILIIAETLKSAKVKGTFLLDMKIVDIDELGTFISY
jgi:hypothetical protein